MLLADVNKKTDEILNTLSKSLDKEGVEGFFNDPDTIKKHLKLTDQDIRELNEESAFYCKHKEYENAAAALTWLIFFEPLNSDHFLRLGSVFLIKEQAEAALECLETARSLDRHNPTITLYMGNALLILNKKEEAKEFFKETVLLAKASPDYKQISQLASEALHF